MPENILIGLFIVFCALSVLYGAYLGLGKAVDWMIAKIFD